MIEIAFNVALYPPSYSVHISFNRFKGRLTAPFWSEPMRVLREGRFINGFLNETQSCSINGFPINPRGHIARVRRDTLVRQEPESDIVELLIELVELDLWFQGHFAQCCKHCVWMLHCVLLFHSYN